MRQREKDPAASAGLSSQLPAVPFLCGANERETEAERATERESEREREREKKTEPVHSLKNTLTHSRPLSHALSMW